ncbi:universal stress protein [Pricia sp. S334]|uniref:Universal stress protein n=1 Tax=Pricia mediterranea TaxID=3076079 RepID=A0ABU3L995_9FLAO|nr:universal stress protein [Pricia sp. S334]MDT7829876.1 universal stress protein [Pricia sp. S334]
MKKIILPTDFSENATNAIRYALHLFQGVETTFHLLHTYTPPVFQVENLFYKPSEDNLIDSYQRRAYEKLGVLRKQLEREFDNPEYTFELHGVFNTLPEEVHYMAIREDADLVIMGSQGATGATEILFGNNATHVIRRASCPLIVVPSGYTYKAPKTVGFPSDYEIDYDKEQLQQLLDICEKYDSKIDVMHVSSGYDLTEEQLRNKQKLKQLLEHTPNAFHKLRDQGVIEAINAFKSDRPMDLLVMIRTKHTFFQRLFVEPVIKKIGLQVNIPFMVIPHEDK